MIVYIIKKNKIEINNLSTKTSGSYWLIDYDEENKERSLINIYQENKIWYLKSNSEVKIKKENQYLEKIEVANNNLMDLEVENEIIKLFFSDNIDSSFTYIDILNNVELTIGKNENANISYNENILDVEAKLVYNAGKWTIQYSENNNIYINLHKDNIQNLNYGDSIFILGLKIILMKDFFIVNNPNNLVKIKSNNIKLKEVKTNEYLNNEEEVLINYSDDDYFYRSPRFRTIITEKVIKIDEPPNPEPPQKRPKILIFGPMITMGLTSLITLSVAIINIRNKSASAFSSATTLSISVAMLLSTLFWPLLTNNFDEKTRKKNEQKRQEKYAKYIEKKRDELKKVLVEQKNIMLENSLDLSECQNVILNKKRNLWERKIEDNDFLRVRLGLGNVEAQIDMDYPEERFSMVEDNLIDLLNSIKTENRLIENVPIDISFVEKNITAVVGKENLTKPFIDTLLLQLITFHSYEELKIVILTDNEEKWEKYKILPHMWDNYKTIRFFGSNQNEIKQVLAYLETEYSKRIELSSKNDSETKKIDYRKFEPYYFIIIDDLKVSRNNYTIKSILESEVNLGFSFLLENNRLTNLPNECFTFINIDKDSCGIIDSELVANKQKLFVPDVVENINYDLCINTIANIPINLAYKIAPLPKTLGFLEMYNVGNVSQLNVLSRWKRNDPTASLEVPIGVDESHELFSLDVHEKFHGPHGLIAGMTGSGKSELIITYILSLAVNYHPDEVSIVIIDYKGGGLAGALYNKETGVKLPHIIGTITNLDTVELKRSLASIESELTKRQQIFKKVRETLNESTVDIYKYQKLYREKKVDTPIPHLLIICDEFAELKMQQPDFMDQLITTARIGRSLGIHLILATQKPAGIVNDQIWSNSRFRICLKVQERSDSMDMIKREDAAALKDVGRFYLQVGFNELFKMGQSAWSGCQYYESDKPIKKVDTNINFIDNVGYVEKSIDVDRKSLLSSKGEELQNIVKYLYELSRTQDIKTEYLWLESMPSILYINDLVKKYNYQVEPNIINPIIGEFDVPSKQEQHLLTMPISSEGNTVIYGSAGSGKENLLITTIYSTITTHTPEEVNYYIIDCGAETLKMFNESPHVGDVILISESEKILKLFKNIKKMIDKRKKLFADYNGNYYDYVKTTKDKLPVIIIIIHYYESFMESYEAFDEYINQFTRDSSRYGIYFILTLNTANGLRYRLRQNFRLEYALQLNDPDDYSYIFSSAKRKVPSKYFGRGLTQFDEVYEFQTALISLRDNINETVKNTIDELKNKYSYKAESIQVLPKRVTAEYVKDKYVDNKIPIGLEVDTLEVMKLNLDNRKSNLIVGSDYQNFTTFIPEYFKLYNTKESQYLVIDSDEVFNETMFKKNTYYNTNFAKLFNSILDYVTKANNYIANNSDLSKLNSLTIYFINISSFIEKLPEELKTRIAEIFVNANNNKVHYFFIESIDNLKQLFFEDWFDKITSNNNALWIGNNISDQYTIKLSRNPRFLNDEINDTYGYLIENGVPYKVKLLSSKDLDEVE